MVKIGITIGDPAGVGPELIVRLSRYFDPQKAYIIYGEKKIIQAVKRELSVDFEFSEIYTVEEI